MHVFPFFLEALKFISDKEGHSSTFRKMNFWQQTYVQYVVFLLVINKAIWYFAEHRVESTTSLNSFFLHSKAELERAFSLRYCSYLLNYYHKILQRGNFCCMRSDFI